MAKISESELADAFESKPELMPYMPELLADLWDLGSSPETILNLIKPLNLSPKTTKVLDLGCGKGAVSITLANKLGFKIFSVDVFKPFLEDAEFKAKEYGVSELCSFEYDDIREAVNKYMDFDIVVYASIGSVLGNYKECIGKLRETVISGGYILIDDGFLKAADPIIRKGYEHYKPHGETIKELTSYGDSIIEEVIFPEEYMIQMNSRYTKPITQRANKLEKDHPELKDLLNWYLKNQEEECDILEKEVTSAIWLIKKMK
jgi:cyclopropane fatty-acyl-phospholipid synthase-like methyltransferase